MQLHQSVCNIGKKDERKLYHKDIKDLLSDEGEVSPCLYWQFGPKRGKVE